MKAFKETLKFGLSAVVIVLIALIVSHGGRDKAGDMPRDCEYQTAPLGNKLCHYELKQRWNRPSEDVAIDQGYKWHKVTER